VRGGILGLAMTMTGVGLVARAAANEELGALAKEKAREIGDELGKLSTQFENASRGASEPTQRGDAGLGAKSA
jgi:hypothetical protein